MSAGANWACPDAEVVMNATEIKDRARWLEEKRKGIGGSEVAALFGEAKYGRNEYSLWLEKTMRALNLDEPTEAMEWGTELEDAIARRFADKYGLQVRRSGLLRSKIAPECLVSVDRLTSDGGGAECKNHNSWIGKEYGTEEAPLIPRQFYWQMVEALAVTGRTHWWLVALIGGNRLVVRRIDRSDPQVAEDITRVLEVVPKWWHQHVVEDIAPEGFEDETDLVVEGRVESAFGPATLALTGQWRQLLDEREEIENQINEVKAALEQELGDGKVLTVMDVPYVQRITQRGAVTFDRARFKRDHPDMEAEYLKTGRPKSYIQLVRRGQSSD